MVKIFNLHGIVFCVITVVAIAAICNGICYACTCGCSSLQSVSEGEVLRRQDTSLGELHARTGNAKKAFDFTLTLTDSNSQQFTTQEGSTKDDTLVGLSSFSDTLTPASHHAPHHSDRAQTVYARKQLSPGEVRTHQTAHKLNYDNSFSTDKPILKEEPHVHVLPTSDETTVSNHNISSEAKPNLVDKKQSTSPSSPYISGSLSTELIKANEYQDGIDIINLSRSRNQSPNSSISAATNSNVSLIQVLEAPNSSAVVYNITDQLSTDYTNSSSTTSLLTPTQHKLLVHADPPHTTTSDHSNVHNQITDGEKVVFQQSTVSHGHYITPSLSSISSQQTSQDEFDSTLLTASQSTDRINSHTANSSHSHSFSF